MSVFRNPGTHRFHSIDVGRIDKRVSLLHYSKFLREGDEAPLANLFSALDPNALQAMGGKRGLAIRQIQGILEQLQADALPDEQVRLGHYQEVLARVLSESSPLWSKTEEVFLLDLIDAKWQSEDRITITDGIVAAFELRRGSPRAQSGVIVPDPTMNNAHPPERVGAPKSGHLATVSAFFVALTAPTSESQPLVINPGRFYPVMRGSFPFLLYADSRGELIGAQLVGYMFSEVFARAESRFEERESLLLALARELALQAE